MNPALVIGPHTGHTVATGTALTADLATMDFHTVAEVAGLMRVSKMTVYRMVHSGELTAARIGRSYRVPAAAVRDYLSDALVTNP